MAVNSPSEDQAPAKKPSLFKRVLKKSLAMMSWTISFQSWKRTLLHPFKMGGFYGKKTKNMYLKSLHQYDDMKPAETREEIESAKRVSLQNGIFCALFSSAVLIYTVFFSMIPFLSIAFIANCTIAALFGFLAYTFAIIHKKAICQLQELDQLAQKDLPS